MEISKNTNEVNTNEVMNVIEHLREHQNNYLGLAIENKSVATAEDDLLWILRLLHRNEKILLTLRNSPAKLNALELAETDVQQMINGLSEHRENYLKLMVEDLSPASQESDLVWLLKLLHENEKILLALHNHLDTTKSAAGMKTTLTTADLSEPLRKGEILKRCVF